MSETFREKLLRWNKYGFDVDVIDKYRDAVAKCNRESIRVLSIMAVVGAAVTSLYGVLSHEPLEGAVFCVFLLLTGINGVITSCNPVRPRAKLRKAGY